MKIEFFDGKDETMGYVDSQTCGMNINFEALITALSNLANSFKITY